MPRPRAASGARASAAIPVLHPVVPRATYRLQLHKDFDFDAVRAVLPYLQRLGISHVYCSPITTARPGSLHGYDVVDPSRINPELGGEAGFMRLVRAVRALDMGLLLDQVPNHMGVFGADNAWWMDVLENGEASEFAGYFDIDWCPPNPALRGKLLVPVLGGAYGDMLDRGELKLECAAVQGTLALHYHQHRFPLDVKTYASVLRAVADSVHASTDHADEDANDAAAADEGARVLHDLAEQCDRLPPRDAADATSRMLRRKRRATVLERLAQALQRPGVAAAMAACIDAINGEPGHDRLHALHEAQAFRLADWRMAADEINYRRFFDINELAALRIEDERVFESVQGPALDLAAQGLVDGFRIDHPDGLWDPAQYFQRVQRGFARRCADAAACATATAPVWPAATADAAADATDAPVLGLYVVSEKITAAHEDVPGDWALHGTTGYRFSNLVNGLFVERRNAQRMERIWRDFGESAVAFADTAHDCKRLVARGAMAAQLTTLTNALQRIALRDRRTRDYGFNTLRDALAEVAAAMPVYRTYVAGTASKQDRQFIDWAVATGQRHDSSIQLALFDFIRRCLLAEAGDDADDELRRRVRAFAMAFQQYCAPVAAKGIEDTAFYRYHRLVSLNEVGGDAGQFGVSAAAFHGASRDRQKYWPHTMLATSTHDNKRSEDVRMRINVLSEQPAAWRLASRRWKTGTRSWRSQVNGAMAPCAADVVLLHQTLLGTLPPTRMAPHELDAYRQRIEMYMVKAAREAKQNTTWALQNPAYEAALVTFVRGLLGRAEGNPVFDELQSRAARIAWFGALNSLAMTVLKFTSPGVPDVYQGNELVEFSLVDPDNRRRVDFALRERMLADLEALARQHDTASAVAALAATAGDARLKLWLAWRLLQLRRADPALFDRGSYVPLRVTGLRRRHAVAFARRNGSATLLVLVARRFVGLGAEPGHLPLGPMAWGDTQVRRPEWLAPHGLRCRELLCHRELAVADGALRLDRIFSHLPLAVMHFPAAP